MARVKKTRDVSKTINLKDFSTNYQNPLQRFENWCTGRQFEDGVTVHTAKINEYLKMHFQRGKEKGNYSRAYMNYIRSVMIALWKVR